MVRTPYLDKNGLKKGAWSPEEDEKLRAYIERYGHWNWRELPRFAGLARCGKSCRLRWVNYLRPNVKHGNYSKEEEDLIIKLHDQLGNRWSKIAATLPGRTDNEIKNHWHTHLKKRNQQHQIKNKKGRNRKFNEKFKTQEPNLSNTNIDNNTSIQILESCPIRPSSPQPLSTTTTSNAEPSLSNSDPIMNNNSPGSAASDPGFASGSSTSCIEDGSMDTTSSWDSLTDLLDVGFWTEPLGLDQSYSQVHQDGHGVSFDIDFWTEPFALDISHENENENETNLNLLQAGVSSPFMSYVDDIDFSYLLAEGTVMLKADGSNNNVQ